MSTIMRKYEVFCKKGITFVKTFDYTPVDKENAFVYAKECTKRGYKVEVYKCVLNFWNNKLSWVKYEIYSNKE